MSACAGVPIEDAVPAGALDGGPTAPIDGVSPPVLRNTGRYPNLNVPRQGAANQFSAGETNAKKGELRRSASGQAQIAKEPGIAPSELERLRELGETHGKDTLKKIEGE
ncbi:hypothetical protein GN330_10100 [Nitratireductor sp. CAU 1489]|uniref:Uncharacterized protein n=1 Tax=Nitratireductor arenosus TaxID=2682096 RepID=A0A844QE92_9HYPH|nr:hypothetical protein [Nitratireductor arenosus]MVA97595.1 hypothetical protein [Nitratireductor arenosus]